MKIMEVEFKNKYLNAQNTNKKKIVFMYAGQGSQYYNMGKELFYKNEVFMNSLKLCDSLLQEKLHKSIISIIYDDSKKKDSFNEILYTHPAIFCFGYSLTQVLYHYGIYPDGVLGYSLGEYTAAVVSGMVTLKDGLNLVVEQAKMLHNKCIEGGMMVIFDDIDNFYCNREINRNCTLSGINYDTCYIISGQRDRLLEVNSYLSNRSILSVILPVKYAFHSELIEPIKKDFLKLILDIAYKSPQMSIYSSACAGKLKNYKYYFWDVIRNKIKFKYLISQMNLRDRFIFVDLSPTGTLSNFIKHGFKGEISSFTTIDQFGKNIESLNRTMYNLKIEK